MRGRDCMEAPSPPRLRVDSSLSCITGGAGYLSASRARGADCCQVARTTRAARAFILPPTWRPSPLVPGGVDTRGGLFRHFFSMQVKTAKKAFIFPSIQGEPKAGVQFFVVIQITRQCFGLGYKARSVSGVRQGSGLDTPYRIWNPKDGAKFQSVIR
jgi:hypothetical protein